MFVNKLFFLFLVVTVQGLQFHNNEVIKITHCDVNSCRFYVYGSWLYVKSRKLKLNEKLNVPHAKWNETEIKNVKGGVLLNIPKNDIIVEDIDFKETETETETGVSGYFNNRQQWVSY